MIIVKTFKGKKKKTFKSACFFFHIIEVLECLLKSEFFSKPEQDESR